MEEVCEMPCHSHVEFILMDSSPLVTSLLQQTREWLSLFGRLLHDIAKSNMAAVQATLEKFSYDLVTDPYDLDDLKIVLQVRRFSSFCKTSGTSLFLLTRLALVQPLWVSWVSGPRKNLCWRCPTPQILVYLVTCS